MVAGEEVPAHPDPTQATRHTAETMEFRSVIFLLP